jgi:hypothetical protein
MGGAGSRGRAALAWAESGIATRRGGAVVFGLALAVFALRSIALPAIPGRDFGTYLAYYAQMWDWDSVVPMSMLYRTPLAPLVVGGSLDLAGGWGLQIVMALLFASSVVVWSRVALVFGARVALLTTLALLVYPGFGFLFHLPASEPVVALAFAVWALALARAWVDPAPGRFALVGVATAAAALARPAYVVLVLVAASPLVLRAPWRTRVAAAAACASVTVAVLGSWAILNGLRYEDTTLARATNAFLPFYRAFTTDHIVSPENGPASRELATLVERELLGEEPYRSYEVTLEEFFERGSPRLFEDVVGLSDREWGWDSDYARVRDVGVEAVKSHPWRYARGVTGSVLAELWRPLFVELPEDESPERSPASSSQRASLPVPSEGELIPAARQGFFATTPTGHITEVWTSPTDHSLVFATDQQARRFDAIGDEVGELQAGVPPYAGSEWLTLQLSRSSKLFPPPLLWLAAGLVGLALRRPRNGGLALALAGAAIAVVVFQALAIYTIVEFAVPVAPALVVLGSAGLLGVATRPSEPAGRSSAA